MASKNILYKILTRNHDFCCLCHDENQEKLFHVEDEVVLKKVNGEKTYKILEILKYVFGNEINQGVSTFGHLCKNCISCAVKSYKFMKKVKENYNFINNSIECLTNMSDSTEKYSSGDKTVFITFDPQNFTCKENYAKIRLDSVDAVLKQLNRQFGDDENDMNKKTKLYDFIDYEKLQLSSKHKKKRKHYRSSVPIKTSEMLHNNNDPGSFKCKLCLKLYPSLSNLRNHFIRVHAPKKFKCSLCDKKFGSMPLVEAHENESHCTVVCKECGKTFHNRHSLKVHELGHYLRIICQDCGRVYKSQSTFKTHVDLNICGQKSRASPANAKFTCDYCNKKYTQKVSLRVHIQYEHGNYKSHECKWCKKKFWAQSRLKAHIVKHTQEKNFSCFTCGGKFVTKESLLYHTRTHTGEKPYKCDYCDIMFLSTSRKADHTKRHHSNGSFQCKICNVKYTTQVSLQKHMKTHESSNLQMYIQTMHNNLNANLSEEDMYLGEDRY